MMDAEQTRTLLAMAGFHLAPQAAQLEEREDRWAALLPGQWMAWFPMNADGLQRLATERRALRLLQACCSFHVPRVLFVAEAGWEIRTVLGASPSQGRGRGGPARARPIARDCPHVWGDPATSFPPTETEAQNSLNQLAEHPHAWAIEHDGRFLGAVGLDAVNLHDRPATLAIGLSNPAKLGMGLGREAIRLVLHHAFDTLGLHRVGLRVIAYNERAIRCDRACGFSEEGREREAAFVAGEWHDDVMMGVLSREFGGSR